MAMKHIELFSGIGGFRQAIDTCGHALNLDFECKAFSEIEPMAKKAYSAMFNTQQEIDMGDIALFTEDLTKLKTLGKVDLITGGFPCQSFSMMGEQKGFQDPRGNLFFEILKIIDQTKSPYVLLENVKNLKTHDTGKTYQTIKSKLEERGYFVFSDIFNSANFDLAQTRNRIYIFATTKKIPKGFEFKQDVIKSFFESNAHEILQSQATVLDVLEKDVDPKYFLSEKLKKTILANGSANFRAKSEINQMIARPLCATMAKMHRACQDNYYSQQFIENGQDNRVASCKQKIRRLTPKEAFRLQGVSENLIDTFEHQYGCIC